MEHTRFMHRCIDLAEKGRGSVGVNPMVGSLLVRNGKIIAEAFHQRFGEDHAEALLIKNFVQEVHPEDILYVNLEPCCHYGKTPPCTQRIIDAGIKTVVFGMYDPNPKVAGKGIEQLRTAGVNAIGPVDPELCRRFNKGFVSLHEQERPWVTLKRAQTTSGRIANDDKSPLKITSDEQDEWSHTHLRAAHDAILVGVETIVQDDPQLTARLNKKSDQYNPLRIVLDPTLRILENAQIFADASSIFAVIITACEDRSRVDAFRDRGIRVYQMPLSSGSFDLQDLLECLSIPEIGITSILVEGGQKTWDSFKKAGVVDEEVILTGKID